MSDRSTGVYAGNRLAGVRSLFAKRPSPYAGADIDNARRLGALLLVMDGLLSLALFPVAAPDSALGDAGWVIAGVVVALMLLGASRLAASKTVSFDELLVISYLMVAQICLFEWLAGGDTPYGNLYLIPLVFTAGIHPPRRLVPMLLVVAVAACLPLVYDGWNGTEAADIGVQLLLWFAAATAMMVLMTGVRDQRLSLRAGEAEAQRLARVDSLTGLGNRRAFDETLTAEISRARRTGNALSVVIIDIDDFKQINDTFGHLNGDRCLREVAAKLDEAARLSDTCFRWGGDEFALLLPESNEAGAAHVAERLCELIGESVRRPDGESLAITFGTAELTSAANADDFLAAADLALMSLKAPSKTHEEEEGPAPGAPRAKRSSGSAARRA